GHVACIEATTANPPSKPGFQPYRHMPIERMTAGDGPYDRDEVAIRFGGPLFNKLRMRYWDLPHVQGRPLVFAVQSFHAEGALNISDAPLSNYLYGLSSHWYHDAEGQLVITHNPIDTHEF